MPGREVADGQPVHRLAQLAADEGQQQAEGVPVALPGVPGEIAFGDDVFAQEAPEPGAERYNVRHRSLRAHSVRSADDACSSSSGVIDR